MEKGELAYNNLAVQKWAGLNRYKLVRMRNSIGGGYFEPLSQV